MRDILSDIAPWYRRGDRFAVATVVRTWSSSPRPIGAAMAVAESGEVIGSVSGGCVEGAVHDVALRVLETGEPALVTYGVSDDDAFAVGLTCGGTIQLYVRVVDSTSFADLSIVIDAVAASTPIAIATAIAGPEQSMGSRVIVTASDARGSLGTAGLDRGAIEGVRGMLEHGSTGFLQMGPDGERLVDEVSIFVESYAPAPRMIIFGATDFAAAMASIGTFIGYHVTVCDARPIFATRRRFPDVDELAVEWPHVYLEKVDVDERTVLCVLTHDPKFDIPLLTLALRTRAGYIGAMGSRRTHADRLRRLRDAGLTEEELARLSSPIGLDIGARTPQETAVSIAAEIVSRLWGGTGKPLSGLTEPIHRISLASVPGPMVVEPFSRSSGSSGRS
jgi:xanthine dehydrogenase accessory factor